MAVTNLEVTTTLRIMKKLIKEEGWKSVFSQIRKHLNKAVGKAWYARNWFFLSILDTVGLIGVDTDVERILVRLDNDNDYSTIQEKAAEKLIRAARKQLRKGGPTLFFDIEVMQTERSAVLIEDLVRARQKEFVHWCEKSRRPDALYNLQDLKHMHHGLLLDYAAWLNDDGAYHEPGSIRWELGGAYLDDEEIDAVLQEFGEDRISELLKEPHTLIMSERMKSIIDALYAIPSRSEMWWSPWDYPAGEEILKPLIASGILDAVQVLNDGKEPWRGVPTSLKEFFQTFSTDSTHPFAVVFLLELNHPSVTDALSKSLRGEKALSNGPTYIIENMSDEQIEENLDLLIEFFVKSDWGESGEYGPIVPDSVHAASRAIEKKVHLVTKEQRDRMKDTTLDALHKWYSTDSVSDINEIVLRTQGPDAIEFAKEAIISNYDWGPDPEPYFVDRNMVEFLYSKKIDPIPILVDRAMQVLYGEWPGLGYMKIVAEYSTEAADAVRRALVNANLTEIFFESEDENRFLKKLTEILGEWAPFAVIGELVLKSCNLEVLATINPASYDWKLLPSYDGFFDGSDWDKHGLRYGVHMLTTPFKQEDLVRSMIPALEHDHEKPRTGAAFIAWAYVIEDSGIKSRLKKLAKKYPDESLLKIASRRLDT